MVKNGLNDMTKEQILISWIDEYSYCPRRFYLRVIEKQEGSNVYLTEGTILHRNVDEKRIEKRKEIIKVYAMEVHSDKYNIYGKCDSVEFDMDKNGVNVPFLKGTFTICPIEFKHGHTRNEREYNMQLTAQALCLEEMFSCHIDYGYIYYANSNERFEVKIDQNLRNKTIEIIGKIKDELKRQELINPKYLKRCRSCALYDICDPRNTLVKKYMNEMRNRYYEAD